MLLTMPWRVVGILNSSFFRIDTVSVNDNGDNEHLALNSARELREVHEGVKVLIGNFLGNIFLL